jgi:hypothetical protein
MQKGEGILCLIIRLRAHGCRDCFKKQSARFPQFTNSVQCPETMVECKILPQLALFMQELVKSMDQIDIVSDNPRGKPFPHVRPRRRQTMPGTQRWNATIERPMTTAQKLPRHHPKPIRRSNNPARKRNSSLGEVPTISPPRSMQSTNSELHDPSNVQKTPQRWASMTETANSDNRLLGHPTTQISTVGTQSSKRSTDLPSYPRRTDPSINLPSYPRRTISDPNINVRKAVFTAIH